MSYMQPVVNLNGTSREALIGQRLTLREALRQATKALSDMAPHLRDYNEVIDWQRDRAVYTERFKVLDRLYNELSDEISILMEQPEQPV
jgi:hypothetical protein